MFRTTPKPKPNLPTSAEVAFMEAHRKLEEYVGNKLNAQLGQFLAGLMAPAGVLSGEFFSSTRATGLLLYIDDLYTVDIATLQEILDRPVPLKSVTVSRVPTSDELQNLAAHAKNGARNYNLLMLEKPPEAPPPPSSREINIDPDLVATLVRASTLFEGKLPTSVYSGIMKDFFRVNATRAGTVGRQLAELKFIEPVPQLTGFRRTTTTAAEWCFAQNGKVTITDDKLQSFDNRRPPTLAPAQPKPPAPPAPKPMAPSAPTPHPYKDVSSTFAANLAFAAKHFEGTIPIPVFQGLVASATKVFGPELCSRVKLEELKLITASDDGIAVTDALKAWVRDGKLTHNVSADQLHRMIPAAPEDVAKRYKGVDPQLVATLMEADFLFEDSIPEPLFIALISEAFPTRSAALGFRGTLGSYKLVTVSNGKTEFTQLARAWLREIKPKPTSLLTEEEIKAKARACCIKIEDDKEEVEAAPVTPIAAPTTPAATAPAEVTDVVGTDQDNKLFSTEASPEIPVDKSAKPPAEVRTPKHTTRKIYAKDLFLDAHLRVERLVGGPLRGKLSTAIIKIFSRGGMDAHRLMRNKLRREGYIANVGGNTSSAAWAVTDIGATHVASLPIVDDERRATNESLVQLIAVHDAAIVVDQSASPTRHAVAADVASDVPPVDPSNNTTDDVPEDATTGKVTPRGGLFLDAHLRAEQINRGPLHTDTSLRITQLFSSDGGSKEFRRRQRMLGHLATERVGSNDAIWVVTESGRAHLASLPIASDNRRATDDALRSILEETAMPRNTRMRVIRSDLFLDAHLRAEEAICGPLPSTLSSAIARTFTTSNAALFRRRAADRKHIANVGGKTNRAEWVVTESGRAHLASLPIASNKDRLSNDELQKLVAEHASTAASGSTPATSPGDPDTAKPVVTAVTTDSVTDATPTANNHDLIARVEARRDEERAKVEQLEAALAAARAKLNLTEDILSALRDQPT